MADSKSNAALASDWTKLLADPEFACNLGKLLKIYRDAPPPLREQALLEAMREIKQAGRQQASRLQSEPQPEDSPDQAAKPEPLERKQLQSKPLIRDSENKNKKASDPVDQEPVPALVSTAPPYEPDLFTQSVGLDRRQSPRIKCFVAVELRVDDGEVPVWGNLSNTSRGGCQVETATRIRGGAKVEIGLWVATGKIWVKGLALNGVVTSSSASGAVRIRFAGMEPSEKEHLRQFLRYIQETTRAANSENSYLQLLK